jgi:hypothetical protein
MHRPLYVRRCRPDIPCRPHSCYGHRKTTRISTHLRNRTPIPGSVNPYPSQHTNWTVQQHVTHAVFMTVFSLCWNSSCLLFIMFCRQNILPCVECGLCPAPVLCSDQVTLPTTMMCCQSVPLTWLPDCLQPFLLRCSCDLFQGEFVRYSDQVTCWATETSTFDFVYG